MSASWVPSEVEVEQMARELWEVTKPAWTEHHWHDWEDHLTLEFERQACRMQARHILLRQRAAEDAAIEKCAQRLIDSSCDESDIYAAALRSLKSTPTPEKEKA